MSLVVIEFLSLSHSDDMLAFRMLHRDETKLFRNNDLPRMADDRRSERYERLLNSGSSFLILVTRMSIHKKYKV